MELAQWFETTIDSADLPQGVDGFRFIFAPGQMPWEETQTLHDAATALGLEHVADIPSAATLPSVLAACLLGREAAGAAHTPWSAEDVEAEVAWFVENIAFSRVIPVRTSPLDLQSLASVLTKGSGVAVGAYAGVVASGGTPLILITVPAGMVLGGAAAGVGNALESGLHNRLRAWIVRKPKTPHPPAVQAGTVAS